MHKFEIIYHRIMDGMRTNHVRDVPAFEFIVQEWLFHLEQEVRNTMGLNPSNPQHWSDISKFIAQQINEQLRMLHIYNSSVANALHTYYVAVHQVNEPMIAAAAGWLMGTPDLPSKLCKELNMRETIDKDNAFDFLQTMATLVVHIGYTGLIVICDEAEVIRGISRPDSRYAACENISSLMDKTAQGEFAHCGFIFAATENLFREELHSLASYRPITGRLRHERVKRKGAAEQQPLILLKGFDEHRLYEIALNVRNVHGLAYNWNPTERLTNGLLQQLVKETAAQFGEKLETIPRGFLKVFIDILDALEQNPHYSAAEVLARGIDAGRIEEIEREEAHLLNHR
jgi:adenosylhomocysteinase